MGTLGYMSPEQIKGKPADGRCDIFAFGAILYEMLSGQTGLPRRLGRRDDGGDPQRRAAGSLRHEPERSRRASSAIVRHCLEKKPEQRFQSAHDLGVRSRGAVGHVGHVGGLRRAASPVGDADGCSLSAESQRSCAAAAFSGRPAGEPRREAGAIATVERTRLTFQRGNVLYARFAADGQTIVFSAAWGVRPAEIFLARVGSPESRALGIPNANLLAVSSRDARGPAEEDEPLRNRRRRDSCPRPAGRRRPETDPRRRHRGRLGAGRYGAGGPAPGRRATAARVSNREEAPVLGRRPRAAARLARRRFGGPGRSSGERSARRRPRGCHEASRPGMDHHRQPGLASLREGSLVRRGVERGRPGNLRGGPVRPRAHDLRDDGPRSAARHRERRRRAH